METIKDRVYLYCKEKNIRIRDFERASDLSNGYISSMRTGFGQGKLNNVLLAFPDLNREWLLYGEGSMLKTDVPTHTATPINTPATKHEGTTKELRRNYETTPAIKGKLIPLVEPTAVAGFGNGNFTIAEADIKEYYIVPKFKYNRVDFMIELSGSSMYPKYNSGDIVACTILHDSSFIQWNKCHVVATREQGLLCKRIVPSDTPNALRLVSDNTSYPPFDVPKDEITGIALVIGVIRLE